MYRLVWSPRRPGYLWERASSAPGQVALPTPTLGPFQYSGRSVRLRDAPLAPPGQPPALPPIVVKHNNEYNDLTPFSAQPVSYREKTYPTAHHLFEAFKFLGRRNDLAEEVRRTESIEGLQDLLHRLRAHVRGDWTDVILDKVRVQCFLWHWINYNDRLS